MISYRPKFKVRTDKAASETCAKVLQHDTMGLKDVKWISRYKTFVATE
jgi:hypothetical protein